MWCSIAPYGHLCHSHTKIYLFVATEQFVKQRSIRCIVHSSASFSSRHSPSPSLVGQSKPRHRLDLSPATASSIWLPWPSDSQERARTEILAPPGAYSRECIIREALRRLGRTSKRTASSMWVCGEHGTQACTWAWAGRKQPA